MKKETKELIEGLETTLMEIAQLFGGQHWLNCKGNDCLSSNKPWKDKIIKGEYSDGICTDPESNFNKIRSLFKKMQEVETALNQGGFVKGTDGSLLKNGDRVIFTRPNQTEWEHGTLRYDASDFCWSMLSDSQEWYWLGETYGEIKSFKKE